MESMPTPIRLSVRWALVLGGVGFAAGFFGPMVVAPESNIGPIIGILFSGPGGLVAGAILGLIFGLLPMSDIQRRLALRVSCAVLAVGTLYYCLPEPAIRGYVIDAQVEACAPPAQALDAAMEGWEEAVARVTWAAPTPRWKETATRNVENDSGVVLTLRIQRKSAILRHRQPWDRGRSSAAPWIAVDESRQYYAADEGSACQPYLARRGQ